MLTLLLLACLADKEAPQVEAHPSAGEPQRCADPSARAALGPFAPAALPTHEDLAGPPNEAAWGLSIADFDGDGWLDLFLPAFGQDRLYRGAADGSWLDATDQLPVKAGESFSSAAADVDGDGDLDLAVTRRGSVAILLNDGHAHFQEADPLPIHTRENYHAAWGDLDGDGLPELFVGTFYVDDEVATPDPNALLRNRGGGRFEDMSAQLGPMALLTPANAGGFVDIDRDGDLDLYVVNDKPQAGFLSVLLENDGSGQLTYDGNFRGLDAAIEGMGMAVGDVNEDGRYDLVLTGWNQMDLLLSDQRVWYEAAAAHGLNTDPDRVVGWGIELVDLDLDMDEDLVAVFGPDYDTAGNPGGEDTNPTTQLPGLYLNEAGQFAQAAEDWGLDTRGVYRSLVVADLNRDGFPDLVARDIHTAPRGWLSRCDDAAWLRVRLVDLDPNPFALGARVRVEAGGRVQERTVFAGSTSIAGSGPPELLFGLGEATEIDRLEIDWSDGAVSELEALPVNTPLTIRRAEARATPPP